MTISLEDAVALHQRLGDISGELFALKDLKLTTQLTGNTWVHDVTMANEAARRLYRTMTYEVGHLYLREQKDADQDSADHS